jgi:hypothetical protein
MGSIDYPPEVQEELEIVLNLRNLPYQAPSSGAAGGGTDNTDIVNSNGPSEQQSAAINNYDFTHDQWTTLDTLNAGVEGEYVFGSITFRNSSSSGNVPLQVQLRLADTDSGYYDPLTTVATAVSGVSYGHLGVFADLRNKNVTDYDLQLRIKPRFPGGSGTTRTEQAGGDIYMSQEHDHLIEDHTHDPNPGLVYFDGSTDLPSGTTTSPLYPEDVCVLVSPTPQPKDNPNDSQFTEVPRSNFDFQFGTDDGTQESFAKVNLTDYLTEGYNEIRIGSKTKGRIKSSVNGEVYQLILGRR